MTDQIESIDDAVCHLMFTYGPDGHNDGHEMITLFIEHLMSGSTPQQALKKTEETND